jgi:hypothetical protein
MKGILPCLVRWALCAITRDFYPALAALIAKVQNIFFLIVQYFNSFVPVAQQAGQAIVPGHLPLNMCLWFTVYICNIFFHLENFSMVKIRF